VCYLAFFWFTHRPQVIFTQLEIVGAHATDRDLILATVQGVFATSSFLDIRRDNALLYPKQEIRRRVKELNHWIIDVTPTATLGGKIQLQVNERTPDALWCDAPYSVSTSTEQRCYFADKDGVIFSESPEYSGQAYLRFVTEATGTSPQAPFLDLVLEDDERSRILGMVATLLLDDIRVFEIQALGDGDYELRSQRPWTILWHSALSPTDSVNNLETLLEELSKKHTASSSPSVIDLRYGNKIFYH